jgi:hypothetical protein
MDLTVIKNDVVNELRSKRYFNEQEVARLVQTDLIPHKERVEKIASLVRQNVNLIEADKLVELYFPQKQAVQEPQMEITPTEPA